jgi:hypothetical protein
VVVTESNTAPVLPAQTNQVVLELATLTVTNSATDSDLPANTLTYQLLNAPTGAGIDTNGIISWTPAVDQGPSTNTLTTVVTDNGAPPLSATNRFLVYVTEPDSPPVITMQPVSRTNNAGATATFTVAATGNALTYQWFKNGTNNLALTGLPSATNATLVLTNTSVADAGDYSVLVSNPAGSVTSETATLTVLDPPVLLSQPASRTNNAGTTAAFTVSAKGSGLSYQWLKNGTTPLIDGGNISGATTSTLTLTSVAASDAGSYSVVITNSFGSVTSAVATLTVIVPPAIVTQPLSRTNDIGTTATFTVSATGTSPAYKWLKNATNALVNGGNISGATSMLLTISNVSLADAGAYSVVVTNAAGAVTSTVANLTVNNTNAAGLLFSDDFSRTTLAPWVSRAGVWAITGGILRGGTNTLNSYANAYLTNSWTNYSVQAQIQFPSGGYGGGIGGLVNRASGAHYAAWVYPEGSPGGSSVIKLVKFQTWTTWGYNGASYTAMQQASLPGVGTNWHTVKMAFSGNQITVSYDSNQVMTVTDTEATPYSAGGVSLDLWTDTRGYTMLVDNVSVASLAGGGGSPRPADAVTPASPPVIESIQVIDGQAVITWSAAEGQRYRLQFTGDLGHPEWVDDETEILATGSRASASNAIGASQQRFYRIVMLP